VQGLSREPEIFRGFGRHGQIDAAQLSAVPWETDWPLYRPLWGRDETRVTFSNRFCTPDIPRSRGLQALAPYLLGNYSIKNCHS
jgi:hypothetical protein